MLPALFLPLLGVAEKIIDRVIPDKAAAEKAKLEMLQAAQNQEVTLALEQIKVNLAEAQSSSAYASGWRPTIGYICATGLCYNFILYPLLTWYAAAYRPGFVPPPLVSDALMELVLGMLGLAGLRSWEKWKGVAK